MHARIGFLVAALLMFGATQRCVSAENVQASACPVIFPDRFWLRDFSLQAPVGDRWCLQPHEPFGNSATIYWKESGWEHPPTDAESAHSFLMSASLDDVEEGAPTSIAELEAFTKKWVDAGAESAVQPSGTKLLTVRPTVHSGRFTLIRGSVGLDDSPGAPCVRYSMELDERDNKLFPGKVLTIEAVGFFCLDLPHPDQLIDFVFSERFVKDQRPAPLLMDSLRPEAEAFVRSLWLDRPREPAAVKRYAAAAKDGWVQAQFALAVYFMQSGQSTDATKWYRAAAEKGHPVAQYNLAVMYADGKGGVPRDAAQAAHWCRLAAEQGDPRAQYWLAWLYRSGDGVPKDAADAMRWLRRAADQGLETAQIILGKNYQKGEDVPKDSVRAWIWLTLGLQRAWKADEQDLARKLLEEVVPTLTPDQLADAKRRLAAWRPGKE